MWPVASTVSTQVPSRRSNPNAPSQEGVDHNGVWLPLQGQPVQQPLDGRHHLDMHGLDEACEVGAADPLGGDDVGDGGEADAVRSVPGTPAAASSGRVQRMEADVRR
jgi:hypothetical protein